MAFKIATWNVNSIRARADRFVRWLEREQPSVVCLQELKGQSETFPHDAVRAAGYHAAVHGQKTYNGVAIVSRDEPRNVACGLGDRDEPEQARLIAADVEGVRVLSAYFPNGQLVGSNAYRYKLEWMERLRAHLAATAAPGAPLVLAGDFNVAWDDKDVAEPDAWRDTVLCHGEAREALAALRAWGLVDVFDLHHPEGGLYSWWDYRMLAFPRNRGLRIDHVYATEELARRSVAAWIDRDERKGGKADRPSDHAPVVAEFELPSGA